MTACRLTDADAATIAVAASRYLAGRPDALGDLERAIEAVLDRADVPVARDDAPTTHVEAAVTPRTHEPARQTRHAGSLNRPTEITAGDLVAQRCFAAMVAHGDVRADSRWLAEMRRRVRGVVLTFEWPDEPTSVTP